VVSVVCGSEIVAEVVSLMGSPVKMDCT
jgi:hypothetical protein